MNIQKLILLFLIMVSVSATIVEAQNKDVSSTENDYIQKELEKLMQEKKALQVTVESLKARLENSTKEGGIDESAYEDLILQKNSLLRQITNIRQEKIILSQKIKNLEDKLKNYSIESELNKSDDSENLRKEMKELKVELSKTKETSKRASDVVEQITKTNDNLRQEIAQLELRLANKTNEQKKISKTDMDAQNAEISQIRKELAEQKQLNEKISKEYSKTISKLQTQNATLTNDIKIADEKLVNAEEKNVALVNELSNSKKMKIDEQNSLVEEIQQKNTQEINKINSEHFIQVEGLKNKLIEVENKYSELVQASSAKDGALEQLKILQTTNQNLRSQVASLNDKIASQNETINVTLKAEAEQFKQTIDQLNEKLNQSTMQNLEAIQNAKKPLVERNNELQKSNENLEALKLKLTNELKEISLNYNQSQIEIKNLKDKTKELDQTISFKDKQLAELNEKLASIGKNNESLQKSLNEKILNLQKDSEAARKAHTDTIIDLNAKHSVKIDELKNEISTKQELIENKQAELANIKSKLNEQIEKVESLRSELAASKDMFSNEKSSTKEIISGKNKEIANFTSKVQALDKEKSELEKLVEKLKGEKLKAGQAYEQQISDLKSIIKNNEQTVASKEKSISEKTDMLSKLSNENKNYSEEIKTILREKDLLNTKVSELTAQLAEKSEDVENQILAVSEPLNEQIVVLKNQLSLKEQQVAERDRTITWVDDKQKAVRDLLTQSEQSNALLKKENSDLKELIANQKIQSEQKLNDINDQNNRKISSLEEKIILIEKAKEVALKDQKSQFQTIIGELEDDLKHKEDVLADSSHKYEELLNEKQEVSTKLTESELLSKAHQNKYYDLQLKNEQAQLKIDELTSQLNQLSDSEKMLKDKQLANSKFEEELKERIELQNNTIKSYLDEIADYEVKLTMVEKEKARVLANIESDTVEKISKLQSEIDSLKAINATQKSNITSLTDHKNDQLKNIELLSKEKLALEQENERLSANLNKTNNDFGQSQNVLENKEKLIDQLNAKIKDLNKVNNEILAKNTALEEGLKELKIKFNQLERQTDDKLSEARSPLEYKIKELEGELINLTLLNQNNIDSIESLTQERDEYLEEVLALKRQKSSLEQEHILTKKKLEKINGEAPSEIQAARLPLETSIKFLERKLLQVEQEKTALEEKLKSIEVQGK